MKSIIKFSCNRKIKFFHDTRQNKAESNNSRIFLLSRLISTILRFINVNNVTLFDTFS